MNDRRKYNRFQLRCPIVIWNPGEGTVIQSETENISCEGIYFICTDAYRHGDRLEATIQVPWRSLRPERTFLTLQCHVEVVRIEPRLPGRFGIGCRIHSQSVILPNRVSKSQDAASAVGE